VDFPAKLRLPEGILHDCCWFFQWILQENQWFPVDIPLNQSIDFSWLVVEPPLWKIWKSMGRIIPSYMMEKNPNVSNHQPVSIAWSIVISWAAAPCLAEMLAPEPARRAQAVFFSLGNSPASHVWLPVGYAFILFIYIYIHTWLTYIYIYIYIIWLYMYPIVFPCFPMTYPFLRGWVRSASATWSFFRSPRHRAPLHARIWPLILDGFGHIYTGWWLSHPSEKYEFVSWDDDIPTIWKTCSKPPTSYI